MSDHWQCPHCGAVLRKGLGLLAGPGAFVAGTATCGACGARFEQSDVYGGKYDVGLRPTDAAYREDAPATPVGAALGQEFHQELHQLKRACCGAVCVAAVGVLAGVMISWLVTRTPADPVPQVTPTSADPVPPVMPPPADPAPPNVSSVPQWDWDAYDKLVAKQREEFHNGKRPVPTESRDVPASAFSLAKECSACGKPVSTSSQAGQRCPHCGAHWSFERTIPHRR